jgi:YjbE family integral membrane protein
VDFLSGELFVRFLGILAIDLILSGDNAVVIALAVRNLEGKTRQRAILLGTFGAVALRLAFAAVVTFLLQIPFLQVVGGLLLLWIAWRLVADDHSEHGDVTAGGSVWQAVKIIVVADVVMSLDNVVALVGVSGGNLWLLLFGIALTIPLIIYGSQLLSRLMNRFGWIVYAGAGVLVFVAVEMVFKDRVIAGVTGETLHMLERPIALTATLAFVVAVWLWSRRRAKEPGERLS